MIDVRINGGRMGETVLLISGLDMHPFPIKIFLGNIQGLRWADLRSTHCRGPWLAYDAFIEGNFPQCSPQNINVFDGTIPLLVRIMRALLIH